LRKGNSSLSVQIPRRWGRYEHFTGMLVYGIHPKSPAEKAGLQEGDVIIELEGRRIQDVRDLVDVIGLEPGRTFKVTLIRQGMDDPVSVEITSAARVD
jgi:S1-C subfamily serine protease